MPHERLPAVGVCLQQGVNRLATQSLTAQELRILKDLWVAVSANGGYTDRQGFRLDHGDSLDQLDLLERRRYISRDGENYRLTILGLRASSDEDMQRVLVFGDALYERLLAQARSPESRSQQLTLQALAPEFQISGEQLTLYLRQLSEAIGLWCVPYTTDFSAPNAFLQVGENVFRFRGIDGVAAQMEVWRGDAETEQRVANDPLGQTLSPPSSGPVAGTSFKMAGVGAVIERAAAHDLAVVIGIVSAARTASDQPAEISDAESVRDWLVSDAGGQLPPSNVRLIVSRIEPDGGLVAPTVSELEQAFRDTGMAANTPSFRRRRLYVFVVGPGFGDPTGRLFIQTPRRSNTDDHLPSNLELTSIATAFRNSQLFEEVVLFADVPRHIGHQGTPHIASLGIPRRNDAGAGAYFFVFSMQRIEFPARITGQTPNLPNPPFERLAHHLLAGLTGSAVTSTGEVTSESLSDYLRKAFLDSDSREQVPDFQSSVGPPILFPRPSEQSQSLLGKHFERSTKDAGATEPAAASAADRVFGGGLDFKRKAADDELCLNVDAYANVLATLFTQADTDDFCFALYGPWGRGKTFLIERVEQALARMKSGYRTIRFSAWKYPTAPEVWVHLYEEFARVAFNPGYRALPTIVRTGIAKHGSMSLLIAYAGLALSLLPLSDSFQWGVGVVKSLYPLFGVAGFIWLLTFIKSVARTHVRLSKDYLRASRHTEKLGLQATIGTDLRALLKGWIPTKSLGKLFVLAYWIISACVIAFTWLRFHSGDSVERWAQTHFKATVVGGPENGVALAVMIGLLVLATCVIGLMRYGGATPKRILLVVDDLDRCKFEHLLSVMESIKLLLEDPEVSCRVQVAMLLEEDVLKHAIFDKYRRLTDVGTAIGATCDASDLITDNCEKLFTAHLRLPTLSTEELRILVKTFAGRIRNLAAQQQRISEEERQVKRDMEGRPPPQPRRVVRESGPMVRGQRAGYEETEQQPTNEEIEQHRSQAEAAARRLQPQLDRLIAKGRELEDALGDEGVVRATPRTASNTVLEEVEVAALLNAIGAATTRRTLGPRSIRALLFRYQLARLLLDELGIPWIPEELSEALVTRVFAHATSRSMDPILTGLSNAEKLKRVVDQVS